jgi:hypothetical protein
VVLAAKTQIETITELPAVQPQAAVGSTLAEHVVAIHEHVLDLAEQLEPIARKIELLETSAIMQIASEAAKIHKNFKYRRDEGGYSGYMKRRLGYCSSDAYRLLDVHKRFGENVSQIWERLSLSTIFLLAAPSTPPETLDEVTARVEAGEKLTCAQVKAIVKAKHGHGLADLQRTPGWMPLADLQRALRRKERAARS